MSRVTKRFFDKQGEPWREGKIMGKERRMDSATAVLAIGRKAV